MTNVNRREEADGCKEKGLERNDAGLGENVAASVLFL